MVFKEKIDKMFDEDKYPDDIQTLVNLGLTSQQSKVFLVLSQLGQTSIKTLSFTAKIDRANVYRTIKQLQELKIVKKFITNPTTFEALTVNEVVLLLLERRRITYRANEVKVKKFLQRCRQRQKTNATEEDHFTLVPGGKLTFNKIVELVGSCESTHDGLLFYTDIESRADFFIDLFRKLLLRGIALRIMIFLDHGEELATQFDLFRNYKNIEIRRTATKPRTTFSIWDKKKAFLTVTPNISQPMTDGLLMDNPALVGLIQDCFDLRWRSSKPIIP